jgi:hypothetical protein
MKEPVAGVMEMVLEMEMALVAERVMVMVVVMESEQAAVRVLR